MKLTVTPDHPSPGKRSITLILSDAEILKVKDDELDRAMIEECSKSNLVSDQLFCLEFIARKIEGLKHE